jgi:hypothetical protein
MKKLFLTILLSAFLVSCELLLELIDLEGEQFYAADFKKDEFYTVRAKILAEGENCVIWAENGSGVTKEKAKEIANKYDFNIRPKIVDAFGMKNFTVGGENFKDILDYANQLAGKKDKKLTILLLDIKDDFNGTTNTSYTAGYFYSGNFYDRLYSNGCDMIYVDTYPGLKLKPEDTYATFAHELQHLINYTTTTLKRKDSKGNLSPMDTWIDEGLSSQAEYFYYGKNLENRCEDFYEDKYGTIAEGNNFFVWGNHVTKEKPMPILDDYSTVYLFFRWLYLQAADKGLQSNIFLDIETSNLSDHRVITNAATKINSGWTDWEIVLRNWLAANYYPENSVYGYKGDSYLQDKIKVNPIKTSNNKISLAPGEGVYSRVSGSYPTPPSNGYIRYAGLPGNSSDIVTQGSIDSGVLLTYNANTSNKKTTPSETGYLTGVSAGISSTSNSRTAAEAGQIKTGPYVIDARDYNSGGILGRDK